MQFEYIPGKEKIKTELKNMVSEERIPHAMLFLGPEGNGGLALAFAMAGYLLCEQRTNDDACGECRNCRRVATFVHPDIHYTMPVISRAGQNGISSEFYKEWRSMLVDQKFPSIQNWMTELGAENKQFNINRKECKEIVRHLSLKSVEAPFKIQIIWLPEYLGKEGNGLLKIIEEPPANTLFFLIVQDVERILNTIISRCQIIQVPAFLDEEVASFSQKNWQLEKVQANSLAMLTEGNMSKAFNVVGAKTNELAPIFMKWMRLSFQDKEGQLIELINEIANLGRERQKQLINLGLRFLRMMMLARMTGSQPEGMEENEAIFVNKMAQFIDFDGISKLVALMDEHFYAVERNANAKILFLDTSFQINRILRTKKAVS